MIIALLIIFFILGLAVGSFLNVVILRLGTRRSVSGRSSCMSCATVLSWYEMVPVISYVCMRGRCLHCKSRVSFLYPVVEFLTALIFSLIFIKFSGLLLIPGVWLFIVSFVFYAILFCLLLVITVHDIRHKIIPDSLALAFGILALVSIFLFKGFVFSPHLPALLDILAGFVVSVPFALIWLLSRGRWMGLGDGKLSVGLGWLLGFWGIISATFLAFWAGAVIGLFIMALSSRYGLKSEVPFAPFLALGAFLVFIFNLNFFAF